MNPIGHCYFYWVYYVHIPRHEGQEDNSNLDPAKVCSLAVLQKLCTSIFIPREKHDKHHKPGIKGVITDGEKGGIQEDFARKVSAESHVYRRAGTGYSEGMRNTLVGEGTNAHTKKKMQSVFGKWQIILLQLSALLILLLGSVLLIHSFIQLVWAPVFGRELVTA